MGITAGAVTPSKSLLPESAAPRHGGAGRFYLLTARRNSQMSFRHRVALPALLTALLFPLAPAASADDGKLALGKKIFIEQAMPPCAICHTLQDAGTNGAIGPNLDELKPTAAQVATAVKSGIGVMPAFTALTDEQVDAVAHYVATVTKGQ